MKAFKKSKFASIPGMNITSLKAVQQKEMGELVSDKVIAIESE